MRQVRHPLVGRDVAGILDHVLSATGGDLLAAERRLDEVDDLLDAIAANPTSGVRLGVAVDGGRGRRLTIVFRPDLGRSLLFVALVAFGGQDWLAEAERRRDFGDG